MKEFLKTQKIPLGMIIVAGGLIFYAVGIEANLFGSSAFSMFFFTGTEGARIVSYVAFAIAIVLSTLALTIILIKKRNVQGKADSLGALPDEANEMLEQQQKSLKNKKKVALRRKELLEVINASIDIIDLSFDILIGLTQKKRINWQQLEGYSNGFGENLNFIWQTMPSLSLNFSKVSSAIRRQDSKRTSKEAYNILEAMQEYINSLRLADDIKGSVLNFQTATEVVLGYYRLNDILLSNAVRDKSKEEISQLETVLQRLANETNFKVNFEELKASIETRRLESDRARVVGESREIFKRPLKQL